MKTTRWLPEEPRRQAPPEYIYISDKLKVLPQSGEGEYVVTVHPVTIKRYLTNLLKENGLPEVRLHDLRHTMASVGVPLNIADKYMMERGGWSNNQTMKKIDQHTLSDVRASADEAINAFFEKAIKGKNEK